MVSQQRPAPRATIQLENLESRTHLAFGDLDPTWGNKGILKLDQYGGPDELEGMAVQPNGQLMVYMLSKAWNEDYGDFDYGRMVLKRRTANGSLDRSFGESGEVTSYEVGYRFMGTSFYMMGDGGVMLVAYTDSDHDPIPNQLYYVDKNGKPVRLPDHLSYLHNSGIGRSEGGAVLISGRTYAGSDDEGESIYKQVLSTWDPVTNTTVAHNLPNSNLIRLSDSTVLIDDWKANRLTRLAPDLKTVVKFGNKDSFTFPADPVGIPWTLFTYDMLVQDRNLVSWTSFFNETKLARIDTTRGVIDRNFGSNRIDASGIFTLPFEVDDINIMEDGSIVYIRTSKIGKIVVGHIARDGMPEATTNTAYNATERVFSPGERVQAVKIAVGKGNSVYVAAESFGSDQYGYAYSKDIYVFKVSMPVKQYGSITGNLFNDFNNNGLIDPGDTPVSSRLVFLDTNKNGVLDMGEWSVITDSKGQYSFTGLLAANYQVRRVLPTGYKVTNTLFSKGSITINNGQTIIANIGSVKV